MSPSLPPARPDGARGRFLLVPKCAFSGRGGKAVWCRDCFDPSRKLPMVWQRLRGCTVVPTPAGLVSYNSAVVGRGSNAIRSIEMARVYHAARRRGGVAAGGARAAAGDAGARV